MNKKFVFLTFLIILSAVSQLSAQSNDYIDRFLAQKNASYDLTCYLVLSASKQVQDTASPEESLAKASQNGWIPLGIKGTDHISAENFSFLLMKSFNFSGGIMYSLFPSPWYAVKEISFRKLFPHTKRSGESLTPFEVLQTLNNLLETQEKLK